MKESEEIWIESINTERQAGNVTLANQLISKGRQVLPNSGYLWEESIKLIPKPQRQKYIGNAIKEKEDDPYIILSAGKLFWSVRKIPNARNWLKRAIEKRKDIGDFWATLYIFELQNGTVEQQQQVIRDCVQANPRYGKVWPVIRKRKENRRKSTEEILKLVAEEMKDVIVEFEK